MVRFRLILEVIEQEKLVDNAAQMGKLLTTRLAEIQDNFTGLVSGVRGRGLMAAFDLPDTETRNKLGAELVRENVIILGCGSRSIRFRPHLNVSEEEIELAISRLVKCLQKLPAHQVTA
jgi:L-lysine 6-transaminase